MDPFLAPSDLPADTGSSLGLTVEQMIEDAEAMAVLAAPCLGKEGVELTPRQLSAVKAIMRGAIMRWNDAGSGAKQSMTAGPFGESTDTSVRRTGMYYPSEEDKLRAICSGGEKAGAFSVDTVGGGYGAHAEACSLNFGALYCSCGTSIAGFPLFETT